MVSGEGFRYDKNDCKVYDIGDESEIEVLELNHSECGLIKYIEYNGINYAVDWPGIEESLDSLPENWEDEL